MPMPGKDDNVLDNFRPYKDEESTSEVQDIDKDYRNLVGKSSDTRIYVRARHTP